VLCVLGIDADEEDKYTDCVADDLISFKANFRRSFGDEFGKAISGDIKNLVCCAFFDRKLHSRMMPLVPTAARWTRTCV
jgi:hypothetical protein